MSAATADPLQQLTLAQYARVVLRGWQIIAACALVGLICAGAYLALTKPTYTTSSSVIVTATTEADRPTGLNTVAFYMERRLPTYAQPARSSTVLQPVLDDTGLSGSPASLARTIRATQPDGFAGLTITVTDQDAVRAATVANAVARQLPITVAKLENPAGARLSPVEFRQRSAATVPEQPLSPQRGPVLVLGALLGSTAGLLLVGARQARRRTLAGVADVEAVTGDAPVALIPFSRTAGRNLIGIDPDAFQVLGQHLPLVLPPPGAVLAVVSSAHREGRTTVAANLAAVLAQAGFSVVLVDAAATDEPEGLRRRLGFERGAGLAAVLRRRLPAREAVLAPLSAPELRVLPGGIDDPGHMLGGGQMVAVLRELAVEHDYVVVDGQPLAGARAGDSIGTAIAGMADAALVVATAGLTTIPGLRRTHRTLELLGTRSLGSRSTGRRRRTAGRRRLVTLAPQSTQSIMDDEEMT